MEEKKPVVSCTHSVSFSVVDWLPVYFTCASATFRFVSIRSYKLFIFNQVNLFLLQVRNVFLTWLAFSIRLILVQSIYTLNPQKNASHPPFLFCPFRSLICLYLIVLFIFSSIFSMRKHFGCLASLYVQSNGVDTILRSKNSDGNERSSLEINIYELRKTENIPWKIKLLGFVKIEKQCTYKFSAVWFSCSVDVSAFTGIKSTMTTTRTTTTTTMMTRREQMIRCICTSAI